MKMKFNLLSFHFHPFSFLSYLPSSKSQLVYPRHRSHRGTAVSQQLAWCLSPGALSKYLWLPRRLLAVLISLPTSPSPFATAKLPFPSPLPDGRKSFKLHWLRRKNWFKSQSRHQHGEELRVAEAGASAQWQRLLDRLPPAERWAGEECQEIASAPLEPELLAFQKSTGG